MIREEMHMEVNHDKLPSLAVLGLIALRSGSDTASGPLFADCLHSHSKVTTPPSYESTASSPNSAASEHPSTTIQTTDATLSKEDSESWRSPDEEQDSDEPAADAPLTTVAPPAVTVPLAEAEIGATAASGEASGTAVVEAEEGVDVPQLSPVPNTEPNLVTHEEPVAAVAATDLDLSALLPETKESQSDIAAVPAEKAKRGKARPHSTAESIESSSEPDKEKSPQPVSKPPLAPPERPETTVELGPPEVAPLDRSSGDEGARAKGAKEVLAVAADNKQSPPVPDPSGQASAPTVDPAVSAAQADASPATGVAAGTPKPPAAFLKSKATHANSARAAGEIDPARFLSRVVKAFESAQHRSSEVRLRLHPAELGALSIEIKVQDSVLTASVQAETPDAKAAIIDNLPALRERLADQGIRIDQFDVDLMDHSDRRQQFLDEQARQQEDRQLTPSRTAGRRTTASQQPAAQAARHRAAGPGGLNVII